MDKIRVLHVQAGSGLSGGIANYIRELLSCDEFKNAVGFVTVADSEVRSELARAYYLGANVAWLPETYGPFQFLSYVQRIRELIKLHSIDIVHAHALRCSMAAIIASRLSGIPVVYTNHGLRFTQKHGAMRKLIFLFFEFLACRLASITCSIRASDHERLLSSNIVSHKRSRLVPTRIRDPLEGREVSEIHAPKRCRVIGVGSLIDVKRPDRFVQWLAALAQLGVKYEAIWVGGGPLDKSTSSLAAREGVKIQLVGELPRAEVMTYLRSARVLLVSSQFEVFPLSVLEAYAFGVPVVCGQFAGVEGFVVDGITGRIVNPDNPSDVAAKLAELLIDSEAWSRVSRQARNIFVERFNNPEIMARQYLNIYEDLTQ